MQPNELTDAQVFGTTGRLDAVLDFEPDVVLDKVADASLAKEIAIDQDLLAFTVLVILAVFILVWQRKRVVALLRFLLAHMRRIMLLIAAAVLLMILINPPWRITVKDSKGHHERTEVVTSFISNQPTARGQSFQLEPYQSAAIAGDVLAVELLCFGVVVATVSYLFRSKTP